ncbi:AmmeMemoRadiSam system radical SAM enzyme [Candidatus Micrarchaeota archaeon]|nr:AmmeMemoRadiSam system radical SAM enzyme [Candidatus Micrarchaeota archaeon]
MKEAMLYEKLEGKQVQCKLCNRGCVIPNGARGFCKVRENRNGILYSLVYGKCCSYAIDPIEKKPFYHFFPGTECLSFATVGCNFSCLHCQNASISQPTQISGEEIPPEKMVELAKGTSGIAYTYTEPTIFFDYAHDTARLARELGLYNVFVTNGYMSREAIALMDFVDASRIDLKAFSEKFYQTVCGGAQLEHVLNSIKLLHKLQHVELIVLLIPTLNDSIDEIRALSKWVRDLSKDIPLHFTAYYPANKMAIPPTPPETVMKARKIALDEGVRFVYSGNIRDLEGNNTWCPNCKELLIDRAGFSVVENSITKEGTCPECGTKIPLVTKIEKK